MMDNYCACIVALDDAEGFEIGDEVQRYNDKGEPMLGTRFIVTRIDDDYLGGIDFGGEIHVVYVLENDEHCLDSWKKNRTMV